MRQNNMYNQVVQKFNLRFIIALLVFVISLAILAWSILPGMHIVRREKIQPTEMQLPTPGSFVPLSRNLALQDYSSWQSPLYIFD